MGSRASHTATQMQYTQPPDEDPRHSRPLECGVISIKRKLRHTHSCPITRPGVAAVGAICEIGRGKKSNESQARLA